MDRKDYIKKIDECIDTAKKLYQTFDESEKLKGGTVRIMSISHSDSKEDTHFELRIALPEETFKGAFYVGNETARFDLKEDTTLDELMDTVMEIIEFYQGQLGENFNIIWLGD